MDRFNLRDGALAGTSRKRGETRRLRTRVIERRLHPEENQEVALDAQDRGHEEIMSSLPTRLNRPHAPRPVRLPPRPRHPPASSLTSSSSDSDSQASSSGEHTIHEALEGGEVMDMLEAFEVPGAEGLLGVARLVVVVSGRERAAGSEGAPSSR